MPNAGKLEMFGRKDLHISVACLRVVVNFCIYKQTEPYLRRSPLTPPPSSLPKKIQIQQNSPAKPPPSSLVLSYLKRPSLSVKVRERNKAEREKEIDRRKKIWLERGGV